MKVISIAGNVTRDCEVKGGGMDKTPFASFAVAVNSGYGDKQTTMFFDVTFWGKRGEAVGQYIKKGTKICVTGELGVREHEGRTYLQIRANDVTLMGSKPASDGGDNRYNYGEDNRHAEGQRQDQKTKPDLDDEIPF